MIHKKNKIHYKRIVIKLLLSFIYLSIIGVLLYSAYTIFTEEKKIVKWADVEKTSQYTYLEISQMSEAFAKIDHKQIHFVMEKETTGAWHTYLIAINEKDYDKYKEIIDYTYERTINKPDAIKVYGYPITIKKDLKALAIKNITKFAPVENEIVITENNFEEYLTDTYLDTTIEKIDSFNYYVLILLLGALVIFIILIYTIFEKDKTIIKEKKQQQSKKTASIKTTKSTMKSPDSSKSKPQKHQETETKKQETKQKKDSKKENVQINNEKTKKVQNKSTSKKKEDDIEII